MSERNEPAVMLVWKAAPGEALTPNSLGFGLRVTFEDWKIRGLTITRSINPRQLIEVSKCSALPKVVVATTPGG